MRFLRGPAEEEADAPADEGLGEQVQEDISEVLAITGIAPARSGQAILFTGRLRMGAESGLQILLPRLQAKGFLPFLRQRAGLDSILVVPSGPERGPSRILINVLLLMATVLTTLFAGATQKGFNPTEEPFALLEGIPFAAGLLLILGTHEMGHYVVGRLRGLRVTLPYFIPIPFGLGTFGAFIRMDAPVKDRKSFFDVGLAGPLAGLVVAIPVLILGLELSEVVPRVLVRVDRGFFLGTSLLIDLIVDGLFGSLPEGSEIRLHPVAYAGWIGLFITGVNFLPAGQLDGGHVAYAIFGRFYNIVAQLTFLFLLALGLFSGWPGWFVWAFFILLSGPGHPPALNDITPLNPPRLAVAGLAALLLVLLFIPVPFSQ